MGDKTDVWQGTLALMILKTLETMGPQHGYGFARRIEQTSGDLLQLNYGTLVSGAAQTRAGGLRPLRVGYFRQQSPREVLRTHQGRPQTGSQGRRRVGAGD